MGRRCALLTFAALWSIATASALDEDDLPAGGGATIERNGDVRDMTFQVDDEQVKLTFVKTSQDRAYEIYFAYFYFCAPEAIRLSEAWKTWSQSRSVREAIRTILTDRVPSECRRTPGDRAQALCWLNKLVQQKKLEVFHGRFLVEGGENVYEEKRIDIR